MEMPQLRPDQKSLEIEYASTLYFDREDIHYFVQLSGAEEDWVDMDKKEFVRYINLKPGEYIFRLKAKNADGEWSQNILESRFKVIPTFFQTAWFLMLCVLAFSGIIFGLYKYRVAQIKKLQSMRNRISHDLHDDVGSTLGSISIYSEVAKTSSSVNRTEVLDKIGEASREMVEKLNDIVWSINPENDTFQKVEARMRSYAAMVLQPKGIEFTLESNAEENNVSMSMEKRRNLFLIFKEAIYNAAKYSDARKVKIRLAEISGKIQLEIEDDGKGFDVQQSGTYNGNGIKSMKERAKGMNGEFQITSTVRAGTKIVLTLR
jgi:signal transduction histidine kinase